MNITAVTITGADDSVRPEVLFNLYVKYPFVEWGILLSRNSQGYNRFPSLRWLNRFEYMADYLLDFDMPKSGHLCGAYVKEFLMGDTNFIAEIGTIWKIFQRIQINTHGQKHEFDKAGLLNALAQFPDKEFIFQYDNVNKEIFEFAAINSVPPVSALFDLSHGAGIVPDKWPLPIDKIKCGYAGGLSPVNLEQQLKLIESKVGNSQIWIDMETHIRSNYDRLFDLLKVELVLEKCKNYL